MNKSPAHPPAALQPMRGSLIDQISSALAERIRSGELPVGSRLPSVRQCARERGVSNETVLRAYDKLVAQGYLEPRRGSGFYVKCGRIQQHEDASTSWARPVVTGAHPWQLLLHRRHPYACSPGDGSLPDAWLDRDALVGALRGLHRTPATALGNYTETAGYLPLRQQLRLKLLEQGIDAQPSQIVTTSGGADALHLVIWANFFPGNYVIAEDPGPFVHIQRMLASGLEIARVPRLEDGPDIEALQAVCERHKPRAFFCSSVLQNPTSTNLSPYKAHQILKLADAFDLLIIDDDTYGDLMPSAGTSSFARLATLDQLERVIHIGSFSKTIAPGLRSGFIAASHAKVERLLLYKSVGAIHGSELSERVVHQILSQGRYRHHCEQLRSRLDDIREDVRAALTSAGCEISPASAGLYLWGSLGERMNAGTVSDALAVKGFQMAPGLMFSSSREFQSYMRFNIAATHESPAVAALAAHLDSLR